MGIGERVGPHPSSHPATPPKSLRPRPRFPATPGCSRIAALETRRHAGADRVLDLPCCPDVETAIHFHNQAPFQAHEVQHIVHERMLTTEFAIGDLTAAQAPPQVIFGIGQVDSQLPLQRIVDDETVRLPLHCFVPFLSRQPIPTPTLPLKGREPRRPPLKHPRRPRRPRSSTAPARRTCSASASRRRFSSASKSAPAPWAASGRSKPLQRLADRQHLQHGLQRGEERRLCARARASPAVRCAAWSDSASGGLGAAWWSASIIASRPSGRPSAPLAARVHAVPERAGREPFFSASRPTTSRSRSTPHDRARRQRFVVGEDRRLEGVPGQHEPLGQRVELARCALHVRELVQPPVASPRAGRRRARPRASPRRGRTLPRTARSGGCRRFVCSTSWPRRAAHQRPVPARTLPAPGRSRTR